jgi:ABC-type multidrug transport system fused ATPase/permease subunit
VDSPEAEGDRPRDRRRLAVLWRLLPLIRPHRARFALAMGALCGASAISLVYPWALRLIIDGPLRHRDLDELNRIVLMMVGVFVVNAVLVWVRHYSISWLGERAVADLRGLVFDRVLTLPLAWFHERRSGELVGRLASDVTVVEGIMGGQLSMGLRNALQLIGALVMLFVIDIQLTLLMLAIVPPLTLATIYFGRRIRKMARAVQDELANVSGQVQESIGAIATVQAFVRELYEARRYRTGVEQAFRQTLAMVRWRSWFMSTAMTAGYVGVTAVVWIGGRALIRGELSAGQLLSFFLYTFIVVGALDNVSDLWAALQRAAGATDRLFAVIDTVPEIRDPEPARALPPGKGAIKLERVSFAYPSRPRGRARRGRRAGRAVGCRQVDHPVAALPVP